MSVAIREARPDDADGLEELAFRARAEWGFEEAVRAADRAELIIPLRAVLEGRVFVAESEGRLHGFFALEPLGEGDIELTHLVIEPAETGLGYGRRLWEQALIEASEPSRHQCKGVGRGLALETGHRPRREALAPRGTDGRTVSNGHGVGVLVRCRRTNRLDSAGRRRRVC